MEAIKSVLTTLTYERAVYQNKIKCIDAAMAALRLSEPEKAQAPAKKPELVSTSGLSEFVRKAIEAMPEGHTFTSRDLSAMLPPHLSHSRTFVSGTIKQLRMPVESIERRTGKFGFTTFRKLGQPKTAPTTAELAVA